MRVIPQHAAKRRRRSATPTPREAKLREMLGLNSDIYLGAGRGVKKKCLTASSGCCTIARVMNLEKIVKQGILYDFYGQLLTAHQRAVYEDVVLNDMSLAEIAEEQGVTRQAVHDLIRRCDRILQDYEDKLGLVAKFRRTRELTEEIGNLARQISETGDASLAEEIGRLAGRILDEG